uniref:Uncharacterized protein n=1 Tax=Meloidogyne enterolobii TaxID=390850 RepID=A0A6V7U5W6_MELEN|nr:unnamed protein product [Meloidogyne enterolobii]
MLEKIVFSEISKIRIFTHIHLFLTEGLKTFLLFLLSINILIFLIFLQVFPSKF